MLASIRFRIVAAFLAGMLVLLAAIGVLAAQVQGVARSQQVITDGYLPLAKTVARLTTWQARIDNDVRRLLVDDARPGTARPPADVTRSPGGAGEMFADELREQLEVARVHARKTRTVVSTPEEQAALGRVLIQLGRIDTIFTEYRDEAARVAPLAGQPDREAAQTGARGLLAISSRLGDEIDTLSQQIDGRIAQVTAQTEAKRVRATAVAGGLSLLAFVIASVLVALILYALTPIVRLTDQVQRLAAGDYTGRVEVRGSDEIASLATEFNAMVAALAARDEALVDRAEQLDRLSGYLTSVLDSLQEGLFVLERGRVTLANPAAAHVWQAHRDAPVPPALSAVLEPGRHELAVGRALYEVRVTPFGGDGRVVVTSDITDVALATERIARSERLALIGQMLAQITHEVRNPLNALSLNAEMLGDELGQFDPERKTEAWEILHTITSEIDRLTAVTGHYLQLARRPPAQMQPVDLGDLVRDVERLLAAELSAQRVGLVLALEPLPPVLADGNQLRQALLNVLRNAVEAGAGQLRLAVRRDGLDVVMELIDDGPGMSTEDLERATDPFYTTKASGTGLGLAITRQILEDHDGSVRVSSPPGHGTTLGLVFPYVPAAAAHPEAGPA